MNNTLSIAWTIARRELRGGLKGFRIFLACLTLGVAAIATVQSLSGGIIEGLRADGRAILGGDVALRVLYNPIGEAERAYLESQGRVSVGVEARSMARREDGARSTLVELKAVDDPYPLYGAFTLREGGSLRDAIGQRDGVWGAVVEETVRQRLDLNVGDAVKVGDTTFRIRGTIEREPDRAASGGFVLGPRLLIDLKAMESTGLIQPGSMITWNYRIGLNPGTDLQAWQNDLQARFPDAGWRVRDFTNAAPQIERFIGRLTLFLTLVGLTALLVGGVGVGNAVRSYLDGKVATIATLKCLGAPGSLVFQAYLLQILVLASLGIVLGLIIGAVAPLIAAAALANVLPITARDRHLSRRPRHRSRLRPADGAHLLALAARPRARSSRRGAVPRRHLSGVGPPARDLSGGGAALRRGARRAGDPHGAGEDVRGVVRRRRVPDAAGLPLRRIGRHLGGGPRRQAAQSGIPAGARQSAPAGQSDRQRRPVARSWPDRAGRHSPDPGQLLRPRQREHPEERPRLLLHRYPAEPARRLQQHRPGRRLAPATCARSRCCAAGSPAPTGWRPKRRWSTPSTPGCCAATGA